jgi:paraquat-inducible protein B
MSDPEADVPHAKPGHAHRAPFALVWVIPIVAAVLGGWIALHSWLAKGPTVAISFRNAEGIDPGKTIIRYKDVNVGTVTHVSFSRDGSVLVSASLSHDAGEFVRADSQFWVVRPRVSAAGISGLSTLFSGAYVAFSAGRSERAGHEFKGLEVPPPDTEGRAGREFILHTSDAGSLQVGAPVLFHRVRAGEVTALQIDPDGSGMTLKVFVDSAYEQFVTAAVRFWQASGVDLTLDAQGLKVETQSAVAVLEGGLAFEAPPNSAAAAPAPPDTQFALFKDRAGAMSHPYTQIQSFRMYFTESLRGLSPGAPVDLHGILVGEVSRFGFEYDESAGIFRFPVDVDIYTDMLEEHYIAGAHRPKVMTQADQHEIVDRLVAAGMRARLKTGNLVTGQLYVDLDFVPNASPARINWSTALPEMPSAAGGLSALADKLGDIATKLDKMPLERISGELLKTLQSLQTALNGTSTLVGHLNQDVAPEAAAALSSTREAMKALGSTLSEASPLQSDLRDTLRQLARSARTLADLSDYLEQHPESLLRGKPKDSP